MGIIKFLFTFFFFYYAIKIFRTIFFVTKTVKQHQKGHVRSGQGPQRGQKKQEDIIDADYKVVDE